MDTCSTFPDIVRQRGGRQTAQDAGTSGKLLFMDKKSLSERDICTKFITPALRKAGWDEMTQIREEVSFTKGRITVRGRLASRGKGKRADYVLYYKPNVPIALIEAKDNTHAIGDGMQQGLDYAETLKIPFVFSSNGDGFVFHDRTGTNTEKETTIGLDAFPSPDDRRSARSSFASSRPASSISSSSTSAIEAAPPRIRPGGRSWSTSRRPRRSA